MAKANFNGKFQWQISMAMTMAKINFNIKCKNLNSLPIFAI